MRNSFIIDKAFNYYIVASIVTAVVSQLSVATDAVIVGQFISPEALSAINAATPLTMAINAMYLLFAMGANVRLARLLGKQDTESVKTLFSVTVSSLLPVGLVIMTAIMLFAESISSFLCKEPSISHYTAQYLRAYSLGIAPMLLSLGMNIFVETAGKPRLSAGVLISTNLFNLIFDFLFVGVLGLGIAGSAWATALSYLFGFVLIIILGVRKISMFKLQLLKPSTYFDNVRKNLKDGFPVALGNISIGVLVFLLNTIIINAQGAIGMNIWSICLQVLMLSLVFVNGTTGCTYAVGGVISGEQDWRGLHLFELRVMKVLMLSITLFVIMVEINPDWLASLFGANDEMRAAGMNTALRLFFLCELPFVYIFVRQAMLQLLEYRVLASVVSIAQLLLLLGGVWIASMINPDYVWAGFPLSMFIVLAAIYVAIFIIHSKKPNTSIVSLIPNYEEDRMFTCSAECTASGINATRTEIESFVRIHSGNAEASMKRIDALTANLLERTEKGENQFCDIIISFKGEKPFVKMKDIQKPFIQDTIGYKATHEVMYGQNVTIVEI